MKVKGDKFYSPFVSGVIGQEILIRNTKKEKESWGPAKSAPILSSMKEKQHHICHRHWQGF